MHRYNVHKSNLANDNKKIENKNYWSEVLKKKMFLSYYRTFCV